LAGLSDRMQASDNEGKYEIKACHGVQVL
jgi:hypothetical protein